MISLKNDLPPFLFDFIEFFSKYSLKDIVNVEENHDVMKGDRYLIELVSKCRFVFRTRTCF